jgi:hypothetical protein
MSTFDGDITSSLVENAEPIWKMVQKLDKEPLSLTRKDLGLFVRKVASPSLEDHWPLAICFACFWELASAGIIERNIQGE